MMTISINGAPCFNMHSHEWDDEPASLPVGPIELYRAADDGSENMPAEANLDAEFFGEYETMMDAIKDLGGELGRFYWATPEDGHYRGFLNHCQGSVAFVSY